MKSVVLKNDIIYFTDAPGRKEVKYNIWADKIRH